MSYETFVKLTEQPDSDKPDSTSDAHTAGTAYTATVIAYTVIGTAYTIIGTVTAHAAGIAYTANATAYTAGTAYATIQSLLPILAHHHPMTTATTCSVRSPLTAAQGSAQILL